MTRGSAGFCGPPDSGDGGYVCGVLAAYLSEPAEVTLRRPPPLGIPLTVTREASSARLEHDGALVAEAVPAVAEAARAATRRAGRS